MNLKVTIKYGDYFIIDGTFTISQFQNLQSLFLDIMSRDYDFYRYFGGHYSPQLWSLLTTFSEEGLSDFSTAQKALLNFDSKKTDF